MAVRAGSRKKRLALALTMIIGFNMVGYQLMVYGNQQLGDSLEAQEQPPMQEVVSKRTAYAKHYLNADGSMTAKIYSGPIHYRDGNGDWNDINTNIGSDREMTSAPYKVKFEEYPSYRFARGQTWAKVTLITEDASTTAALSEEPQSAPAPETPAVPVETSDETPVAVQAAVVEPPGKAKDKAPESPGDGSQASTATPTLPETAEESVIPEDKVDKAKDKDQPAAPAAGDTDTAPATDTAEKLLLEVEKDKGKKFKSRIKNSEMLYEDVLQDTDLMLIAKPSMLEKWLILKRPSAPHTYKFEIESNRTPTVVGKHLEWADFDMQDVYAVDANGSRGDVALSYGQNAAGKNELTLTVDPAFLQTAMYPVKVDPTLGPVVSTYDNGLGLANPNNVNNAETAYNIGRITSSNRWHMLLWFDTSSVSGTVTSATLVLTEGGTAGRTRLFELHRVSASWNTAQVSWNNRLTGTSWVTAGGDYDATAIAQYTSTLVVGAKANLTVTSTVRGWVDAPATNYGFLWKLSPSGGNGDYSNFCASEHATASYRPVLTVNYNVLPNAPTGLTQKRNDGTTVIPQAGPTTDGVTNNIFLESTMTSTNNPDTLTLKVEIRATGVAFTNVATHVGAGVAYSGTGVKGSVPVTGLSVGTSYHWQAWVTNSVGDSTRVAYGTNTDPDDPDVIIGTTASMVIDSTFNRDGTNGSNSTNFGSTAPNNSPFVIHTDAAKHAIQLTIMANTTWSLKTQAGGALDAGGGKTMPIGRLEWRRHATSDSWVAFQTTPYTILGAQSPTAGTVVRHDYRLTVNWTDQPGAYTTTLSYTVSTP